MKLALAFLGGAVAGGLLVRWYAIHHTEDQVGGAIDSALGKGTWYGGVLKTFANGFIEGN